MAERYNEKRKRAASVWAYDLLKRIKGNYYAVRFLRVVDDSYIRRTFRTNFNSQSLKSCQMGDNSLLGFFDGETNKRQFFFEPSAKEIPANSSHEISQTALFLYINKNTDLFTRDKEETQKLLKILGEIDGKSRIVQVETHRQRMFNTYSDGLCEIFIVFQTVSEQTEFWWSLDKYLYDYKFLLQRSRDKDSVKNKFKGNNRERTELISEKMEGKGCIKELLTLLWIHMTIHMKYQRYLSRCESIIPLIMTKITKERYQYDKNDFKYSALSAEERNPDLADIIEFLLNVSNWHPLIAAIYLMDVEIFDEILQGGEYNINGIYNKFTLLNFAILYSKREMIQHLLLKIKVNPLKKDERGRNALHMAAKFNRETEIINLLLEKIPIDECDESGTTALNHAIMASNTPIVDCLLENGADPEKCDQSGRSPLQVAAFYTRDAEIIDLLLKKEVDIDERNKFEDTALHNSAIASNKATACHLIIKGADVNCRNKRGLTPLHVAAFFAEDMDMINLFFNNKKINLHCCDELGQNVVAYAMKNIYGLRQKIVDRLKEKDGRILKEHNVLKQAKSEMRIPICKRLVWNVHLYSSYAGIWLQPLAMLIDYSSLLKENKLKLFYFPYADLKPGKGCEISEPALCQCIANENLNLTESEIPGELIILSDIDHNCKIKIIQTYQNSINMVSGVMEVSHFFIILKTTSQTDGDYWWSLEKKVDFIVLQRSRDKDAVIIKFEGKERNRMKQKDYEHLIGKNSIKNLFSVLLSYRDHRENDGNKNPNSRQKSFVTFVGERITEKEDEYEGSMFLFVPNADTNPAEEHEIIFDAELFRYLLNEEKIHAISGIDKHSRITEFETHNCSMGILKNVGRAFHVFIVFKTTSQKDGDYWWSLEKNIVNIVLQKSRNKNDVKDKSYEEIRREDVQPIVKNLKGKGTIKDLLTIIWAHQMILKNNHIRSSNNQSLLVTLVSKRITEIGYEYEGFFMFSQKENDRKTEIMDLINLLAGAFNHQDPFFTLIFHEKTNVFDQVMESGNYDINVTLTQDGLTPLHLAVFLSKSKMVRHLLDKWKVDPTKPDTMGMNALQFAATKVFINMDIINLLLEHEKVDINERDMINGWTALHFAANVSNAAAVKHLIEKGADPNIYDRIGWSPLHLAARENKRTDIIDLILQAKRVKQNTNMVDQSINGTTALHIAVMASNKTTLEYLIENGADINCRAENGYTALDLAEDRQIFELLLLKSEKKYFDNDEFFTLDERKKHGLKRKTIDRFREFLFMKDEINILTWDLKELIINSDVKNLCHLMENGLDISRATWKEEKGNNALHMASRYAMPDLIDLFLDNGQFDINGGDDDGKTPFHYAIERANPAIIARHLINKGADPTVRDKNGNTPLHVAVKYSKDIDTLDLFLANEKKFDINERNKNGLTALHMAMHNSNVTTARYLIENEADPNVADENGLTPLHLAASFGESIDLIDLILKTKQVDINARDNNGETVLYKSLQRNNPVTTTRYLLENGADPTIRDMNGKTLLHVAAEYAKDMGIVELLLSLEDVDVNDLDKSGRNALYYAKENQQWRIRKTITNRLKENGAIETEIEN